MLYYALLAITTTKFTKKGRNIILLGIESKNIKKKIDFMLVTLPRYLHFPSAFFLVPLFFILKSKILKDKKWLTDYVDSKFTQ